MVNHDVVRDFIMTHSRAVLAFAILIAAGASAQTPTTGSRLPGVSGAQPLQITQFKPAPELKTIRRLLADGKALEARKAALAYVEKVERAAQEASTRYFAYNALCVVFTNTGELDKAEEECSRAVDMMPSQWQALGNRGTVRMVAGDYEGAWDDFVRARAAVGPQNEDAAAIIVHNAELLRQRMDRRNDEPE